MSLRNGSVYKMLAMQACSVLGIHVYCRLGNPITGQRKHRQANRRSSLDSQSSQLAAAARPCLLQTARGCQQARKPSLPLISMTPTEG